MKDDNHGIQLMQKTGQIERTVDHEFQEELDKFKTCVLQPISRFSPPEESPIGLRKNVRHCRKKVKPTQMLCEVDSFISKSWVHTDAH